LGLDLALTLQKMSPGRSGGEVAELAGRLVDGWVSVAGLRGVSDFA
jgi:hypothetical protein